MNRFGQSSGPSEQSGLALEGEGLHLLSFPSPLHGSRERWRHPHNAGYQQGWDPWEWDVTEGRWWVTP